MEDRIVVECNREKELFLKNQDEIEKELRLINSIIGEAISHGGDSGGSYCTNGKRLNDAIIEWLNNRGLADRYTTDATVYGHYDGSIEIGRIPDDGVGFIYLDD